MLAQSLRVEYVALSIQAHRQRACYVGVAMCQSDTSHYRFLDGAMRGLSRFVLYGGAECSKLASQPAGVGVVLVATRGRGGNHSAESVREWMGVIGSVHLGITLALRDEQILSLHRAQLAIRACEPDPSPLG